MKRYDLLKRAEIDLRTALLAKTHFTGDEAEMDVIAYHIQQCIEKTLKYILSSHGIKYRSRHGMRYLYDTFKEYNLNYPDELKAHWDVLDAFESDTRYSGNLVSTWTVIDELIPIASRILEQQQLQQKQQQQQNRKNH